MRELMKTIALFVSLLFPGAAWGQGGEPVRESVSTDSARAASVAQLLANSQSSLQRGDIQRTIALLDQVLALEAGNKPARKTMIQLLLLQGKLNEADQQVQTLGRFYPNDAEITFLRAAVAFQSGELQQASDLAEACLRRGEAGAEVHKLLAMAQYLLGQVNKFETHIREASRLAPFDPEPHYHLGRYYFEDKRYDQALNAFKQAFRIRPDHFKAHYYAGLVYEGQNQIEQAKQEFQAAIHVIDQQKIKYAWPYSDMGRLLVGEDDYERGIGWLYRAVRNDPASPYARYHYAKALFRKGATFEVKQELFEAIKLDPGYGDAYYLLARYYQKIGEAQRAKETFAKFEEVKKNPPPSPFGVRRW
jgi:tetratricopeptide (TPR) repeat protein